MAHNGEEIENRATCYFLWYLLL